MSERIQKVLARAGAASRRQADRWVAEGRVTVNGFPAATGQRVDPEDRIAVDGRSVSRPTEDRGSRCLAYHKPEGELCTRSDPEGRPTVFDRVPEPEAGRWITVGRLDLNSSGLLLVTNDGELANALMHPSRAIEREYLARVRGDPSDSTLGRLEAGVELEDGPARLARARRTGARSRNATLRLVIREGRKREVRRLLEAVGHPVSRLRRIRFGPMRLPEDLEPGQWRELGEDEVTELRRALGERQ